MCRNLLLWTNENRLQCSFSQKEGKTFFLKCSRFLPLCCQQDRLQNMRQPALSYIKYQVHRVHMQNRVFTHCRSKTQLGYHCAPLSEVLYQSQYLASCTNGCCVEPSNSTGAGKGVNAKQKRLHWALSSEKYTVKEFTCRSKRTMANTHIKVKIMHFCVERLVSTKVRGAAIETPHVLADSLAPSCGRSSHTFTQREKHSKPHRH